MAEIVYLLLNFSIYHQNWPFKVMIFANHILGHISVTIMGKTWPNVAQSSLGKGI